jgi:hypothetical protein
VSVIALNQPRPLVVEAMPGPDGPRPRTVVWRGRRRVVVSIDDEWQVDDEWWCDEICRRYFAVTLADGARLTLYYDQLAATWWAHGGPGGPARFSLGTHTQLARVDGNRGG